MKRKFWGIKPTAGVLFAFTSSTFLTNYVQAQQTVAAKTETVAQQQLKITNAKKINATTVEITFSNQQKALLDFYGDNIFRLFQDNSGKGMRDPEAKPEAKILVNNPRKAVTKLNIAQDNNQLSITTDKVQVVFDKNTSLFKLVNLQTKAVVVEEAEPLSFEKNKTSLTLKENPQEYFYGGGVQNGRFSHKGKAIAIENQNSWTDGGVASPTPFYWSSKGYGMMWYTFKKGKYDFGAKEKGKVSLSHEDNYLDLFLMVNYGPVALLNDFYQLTGNPVLLPKFGFYEGHLNAYNRDYWKEDEKGILFEDGKRYKESQKENGGTKESLNGEKNNYQFSARAVVDRYKKNDMPLGWVLPNDGYGAGYGQTETLGGNIKNLKEFGDYARKNGVEIGLWTQSDLHPKEGISALLQRDIIKEVRDAGVRVLKTDVAWVGDGYSFGLNGVADVGEIMPKYGNDARPFIISLDGWAGTQRYAGIWSGDQTGGVWEYIRFHIPTYIGSGLSGQPNITSDMDGIFGGKKPIINTRDFQWKAFTPMQLNMDGWGSNEKYPHALGEIATSINRNYLKLKSELLPYSYSIAKEAVNGLPMIRAMFLEEQNAYTQGKMTQYQFMYGPAFLVAPIYQETKTDDKGNDIRNGIYLPKGQWIDYLTGEQYEGGQIINSFDSPIWKLPVFVKRGAIIPLVNPNNNVSEINKNLRIYEVYPLGKTSFTEYDDDGISEQYKAGKGAATIIESNLIKDKAVVTVFPAKGNFEGQIKEKATEFRISVTVKPGNIIAKVGNKKAKLKEVTTLADFEAQENVFYYNEKPDFNRFSTKGTEFEKVQIIKNPQILVKTAKVDITNQKVSLEIEGYKFEPQNHLKVTSGILSAPKNVQITDKNLEAYAIKPTWDKVPNADYYEIDFNGLKYSTIKDTELLFEGLTAETDYAFKVRAVNKDGVSDWATISARTKSNPLEFAIKGISGTTSVDAQEGFEVYKLFDEEEGNMWHTKYRVKAVPFDLVVDLKSINQLDKFQLLPRNDGRNGLIQKGKVSYSMDKQTWTDAGTFEWKDDFNPKEFAFTSHPAARYVKISVEKAVGDYGTGRELYVFKVPGTESYLPGDINNDKLIDRNDLTSYTNYTGLRKGDADFEGYVSNGDVNKNNLIDAYDISVVATQLDGGVDETKIEKVSGKLEITTPKQSYNKDEIIEVTVKGANLKSVNALSFALPYNAQDYEFVGIQTLDTKKMENLTNDRLHSNREKVLYPTFVNLGKQEALNGSNNLFIIKFKAKKNLKFNLKPQQGLLVDKDLNSVNF
ncbi:TIM-barrel domain-containing protein [Elizabethkingia anophelis]|uniref:TIM-barrel domain-containing protein n=1 Tax=Elizabethkingia anophelis TaxID=1117645 RepID=UPI00099A9C7B|nr:TIM-barrel domain-containing protein [Elizabethkingia anophelis]MCT3718781.1 discoidin domain-containing protein [Elizabethkingia anophelis]MCT3722291.1 discoidin domain-containing protein [Elizabethkingia anophelis]MCT3754140.1 discoidin domain-containing protein [Elizabethkingia anophelis]MCT3989773.1 discoidin domain-containing protein [Elizabethkingia anophelis]MCT4004084.1 discoidin domain-containing protein [Elizabethkingia anophelis]